MTKLSISEIAKLDKEIRVLVELMSRIKLKGGVELGERLKPLRDQKLYLKLDATAYPTFETYLDSVGLKYKTATEYIGLFESFVLAGGLGIEQIKATGYHKLTIIKPHFFKKEGTEYKLIRPKSELNKWLKEAATDITQEDLKQKRRDEETGPHRHDWEERKYKLCKVCRVKEWTK